MVDFESFQPYFSVDDNFVSGFKNQGPYYAEATNLKGGDTICMIGDGRSCRLITSRIAFQRNFFRIVNDFRHRL